MFHCNFSICKLKLPSAYLNMHIEETQINIKLQRSKDHKCQLHSAMKWRQLGLAPTARFCILSQKVFVSKQQPTSFIWLEVHALNRY